MTRALGLPLALAGLLAAGGAAAQSVPDQLPRPFDPLAERAAAVEPLETPPAPEALVPRPAAGFVLRGVRLEGAVVFDAATLAPLWADLLGTPVDLATLEAVAAAVAARYRAEGFVLAQAAVPEQIVEDGVVVIQVIEGFIDRLTVEGAPPAAVAFAERRFAPVAAARPLALGVLERSVLLSRDTLGGQVETVLAPSATTFGAADMTVLVEPAPMTGFVAADNRGSRLYGDVSAAAGLTLYGPLGFNEQVEIVTAGDPVGGDIGFLGGTLTLPLGALDGTALDGARLAVGGEVSTATPDLAEAGSPEDLDVTTDEWTLGAEVTVPFRRTRSESVFGRLRLDYRESENSTIFAGTKETATDELLVLEAGVSWDRADRIGGVTILDLDLRQGLSGSVGETGAGAPSTDFTRGRLRLARIQRFGGEGWSIFGELVGQAASGSMPSAERFSLGGATVGRGFAPGNTSGDSGLAGRLELRRVVVRGDRAAELYGFGDYGEVRNRNAALRGVPETETIGSIGLGARIDLAPWLTLTPELVRQVSGRAVDTTRAGLETRAFIGAVARF